ncbi:hypothetical protein CCP2SC5_880013 [Azospirillaceae bacterium]
MTFLDYFGHNPDGLTILLLGLGFALNCADTFSTWHLCQRHGMAEANPYWRSMLRDAPALFLTAPLWEMGIDFCVAYLFGQAWGPLKYVWPSVRVVSRGRQVYLTLKFYF